MVILTHFYEIKNYCHPSMNRIRLFELHKLSSIFFFLILRILTLFFILPKSIVLYIYIYIYTFVKFKVLHKFLKIKRYY